MRVVSVDVQLSAECTRFRCVFPAERRRSRSFVSLGQDLRVRVHWRMLDSCIKSACVGQWKWCK